MTDLPISQMQATDNAGEISASLDRLIALLRATGRALAHTITAQARRMATRPALEEILAAQARREEARRAVNRLLQLR